METNDDKVLEAYEAGFEYLESSLERNPNNIKLKGLVENLKKFK
jgi:hypothetical protein